MEIIKFDSIYYPEKLRKIKNPPKQIYVLGNVKLLNKINFAIVGSRKCTSYGEKMAIKFAKELSKYEINIVSGLALGIDTFVHKSTLEVNGKTIAVLPSGFNYIYPKSNESLLKKIIKNKGCVISEYPINQEAISKNFLERNRIVCGISIGTLVVEGGVRSGTSVTARLTIEQGKPVFCIPSSLENKKGYTTNLLIKKGAFLVTNINDIIKKFEDIEFSKNGNYIDKINSEKLINSTYKNNKIYKCLLSGSKNINQIIQETKLPIGEINYSLMLLQMEQKILELPGGNYKII